MLSATDTDARSDAPHEDAPPSRRLLGRDVLGVNAVVLTLLLVPLVIGFTERLRQNRLFAPDSRYYVTMAYRDSGLSLAQSLADQLKATKFPAGPWYFGHDDPVWLMVQPRMLYPLLSAPFVRVLGPDVGMLAVPMLAIAVTVWAAARLVQRLYGPFVALAAAGLLAMSTVLMTLVMGLTDPLAMALVALLLLNLPIGRPARGQHLVWLGTLSVLLCLTRQVLPVTAGMAAGAWLWAWLFPGSGQPQQPRRVRNDWFAPSLIVGGIALAGQVIGTALAPYDASGQFLLANHQKSMGSALVHLPQLAWDMTRAEVLWMVQNDRYLLVLMAASLVFAAVRFRTPEAGLFIGALAGMYALIIANGIPSQMRYESILLPAAVLGVASLIHRFLPDSLRESATAARAGVVADSWWQGSNRRVPVLAVSGAAVLAAMVLWSGTHGSASTARVVPTSPPAAAALAGSGGAETPLRVVPGEDILRAGLQEATATSRGKGSGRLVLFLDWRHPLKYDPYRSGDPGWDHRGPDGTATIRFGDFVELAPVPVADGLSLGGTLDPATLSVRGRTADAFGEDVAFEVSDRAGVRHRGHATVLYPTRDFGLGLITELIYES